MSHQLENKRALVAGGSRGIGAAPLWHRRRNSLFAGLLASPEASYVTGSSLSIDGGFTA